MPFELVTIPCLSDNYAFLLHNSDTQETCLVDVPQAAPIQAELDARSWTLTDILLTHHHWDHIDALPDLTHTARIIGAAADAHRLPPLDLALSDDQSFELCGTTATAMDVPGHTVGHIAVHVPAAEVAFTADSLMALGCGRLFEGTPPQMWDSLQKLRALPPRTQICSGHEYTQANAAFAVTIEPNNTDLAARVKDIAAKRAAGIATVPSSLALEIATNPFLRADVPNVATALGMSGQSPADIFTQIRRLKDHF